MANDQNALPVYGTEELLGAFGVIDNPKRFLLEMFFPTIQTFDGERVAFDKIDRSRRKAPFVSPNIQGKVIKSQGYKALDFQPAYVKPRHVVDMSRPLKRRPGERFLGGQMSPLDRYQRAVLDNLALEDDMISRTEEWMAAQALLSGTVTVVGEDFPSMTVDYLRPSAHTVALTGSARWGQSGVSPLALLRSWNATVMQNSGFNAKVVVMDPLAADKFLADTNVRQNLNTIANTPVNGAFPQGNLQLSGVLTGAVGEEVKYIGEIGGFEIWQYAQAYTEPDGTVQQLLPANTVIMGSPAGAQGVRTYGAIRDKKAGLKALERFPKMWDEEDPSVTYTMTQSAPLPVLGWAEATLAATVA